jgi:1-deoxyxylulose-5-phosphate synthase
MVHDDLVRQGKLRYVALSNHPAWQLPRRFGSPMTATWPPRRSAPRSEYNLIDRAAEDELGPASQQFRLSVVTFGPFSGDKRFGGSGFTDTELEIGRAVERLSQEWGLEPYQVSLAWLLSRPAVVGAETAEEVTANATAAAVTLDQPSSTP